MDKQKVTLIKDIDYKRNAIFVVFGFVYLGGFQYWLMATQYMPHCALKI